MKLLKWFTRAPNYAPQVLDDKVKDVLNRLDSELSGASTPIPADGVLTIKSVKIGLFSQHFPVERVVKEILLSRKENGAYIPRSIAFLCDQSGSWCFYIGYRESGAVLDEDKCDFFADVLSRTNNARSAKEKPTD